MNFADLEYNSFDDLEYIAENEAASFQTIFYISNLLRNSTLDEDKRQAIEISLDGLTQGEASVIIRNLQANQLDKFRDTNRYNQGDLIKHFKEIENEI